jgi:Zn-dependent metalloprotease
MRSGLLLVSSLLSLAALVSCGTSADPLAQGPVAGGADVAFDEPVFGSGDAAELELAENLSYEVLYGPTSPALAKGVDSLRTTRVKLDDLGMAHTRVQQLVNGVPVFGGEAIVHLDERGKLFTVTDNLLANVRVNTTPDFSKEEAMEIAAEELFGGEGQLSADPEASLWVLRHEGVDHLVWRVQLRRTLGQNGDTMPLYFIDAHSGELVWGYENLQSATCSGSTNYYGTVSFECYTTGGSYYTEDATQLLATFSYNNTTTSLAYVSSTSTTFGTTQLTKNAVEAYYVLQKTNDFFYNAYGRNGIDGAGGPAAVTTHGYSFVTAATSYSRNYVNAYWDGSMMVYGDGDGVNASSLTALDIGGHELAHGVTEYEANLTYSGESGHLNESTSDVFGAMVERSVLGESTDTWLVGEDAWTPGVSGDALRYMNDPADDGYSYDYYSSSIGSVDVHYGSGVPNLVFYLMSEGGTHPRGKSTVSVTGIGADDAADIWYLALTNYMTSSTNFSAARTAMLSAAQSLYGSTTSTQYKAVQDAWAAVGVGTSSSGGGGSSSSCTSTTYTGSLSKSRASSYAPSSSGSSVTGTSQTVTLTGPSSSSTDFDLYLQKKSGSSWSSVASSTNAGSTESISYSGTSGTYRVRVYSYSGSGSFSTTWCR